MNDYCDTQESAGSTCEGDTPVVPENNCYGQCSGTSMGDLGNSCDRTLCCGHESAFTAKT